MSHPSHTSSNRSRSPLPDIMRQLATAITHSDESGISADVSDTLSAETRLAAASHYLQLIGTPQAGVYASVGSAVLQQASADRSIPTCNEACPDYGLAAAQSADSQSAPPEAQQALSLFPELFSIPFPAPAHPTFTFIDLFAGIGGFRLAMQRLGGRCVFSSEWDEQAKRTYAENYGELPFGDITQESTKNFIPENFDILCAGFPCQAFSLAGKRLGFEETRGTLFFDVAEIIRRRRPKAFFLENVKGLLIHDHGRTIETILRVLRENLRFGAASPACTSVKKRCLAA